MFITVEANYSLIAEVKELLNRESGIKVQHVYREVNQAADGQLFFNKTFKQLHVYFLFFSPEFLLIVDDLMLMQEFTKNIIATTNYRKTMNYQCHSRMSVIINTCQQ